MKTKLTLSIEKDVKERAKRYAKQKGISVSKMVERFLESVSKSDEEWQPKEGSAVAQMLGSVKDTDKRDYEEIIVEERIKKYENHSN